MMMRAMKIAMELFQGLWLFIAGIGAGYCAFSWRALPADAQQDVMIGCITWAVIWMVPTVIMAGRSIDAKMRAFRAEHDVAAADGDKGGA